jgi:DNA helicase-2/ATP-dependent DNA helicase PcrA
MKNKLEFTDEQKKAIEHEKGHLRILACAGSGKTEIVSQRIARLIQKGIKPKTIVAFTFTNKAADELKGRIKMKIDEINVGNPLKEIADFGDMFIGTIDAFCFYILKELLPSYKSYDILEEASRIAFISRFYHQLGLENLGNKRYSNTTQFANDVDMVRRERINVDKLRNQEFVKCYKRYIDLLNKEKFLDFEGVIHTLLLHLEDKSILQRLGETVKHLVVDEYQDVNDSQEKLIREISKVCDSVCVVGDDDQCLYHWRGSEVNNIVSFEKRYQAKYSVITVPLLVNYRSTEGIIHTARKFISKNMNREKKEMEHWGNSSREYEEGDICHKHFEKEEEEFEFIMNTINHLKDSDYTEKNGKNFSLSYRDIAILVRTNEDAAKIISWLEEKGIPAVSEEGKSALESPEAILALKCISYLAGFDYFKHERFTSLVKQKITKEILKEEYNLVYPKEEFKEADVKKFLSIIEFLKKRINTIKRKSKDYLPDKFTFQNIFHFILCAFGADRFDFNKEKYEYQLFNLSVLSQAISDFESVYRRLRVKELGGFLHFIATYGEGKYRETTHSDASVMDRVRVMTVHKAKGLQFPVVFMPCRVKKGGYFPGFSFIGDDEYNSAKYEGTEEDERRVWYVAMTRSEKYLFITSSKNRIGKKRASNPHEFIEEFDKKYISSNLNQKIKHSSLEKRPQHYNELYPTSFSEISAYKRCPYDFKIRHKLGLNAGVPVTFGYGTNIHNILNIIYKEFKKRPPTEKEIDRLVEKNFYLRYATEQIKNNMVIAGKKIIKRYVDLFASDFKNVLETEKRFEFVLGEASISGQIDLIKKVNDVNQVVGIEIIDFKTDKDGPYERDYQTQLRLYTIACMESLGLDPKKASIHHLDKKTKQEIEDKVDISKEQLELTKKELSSNIGQINKEYFPAKPKKKVCEYCDYRFVCSKKCCRTVIK